ncbi:D-inositol 3-phosphate glycosyltransferase [bacterium BMS3Abin07]|nr:D-inositol 3-phosphate glycosyltransferase [bacterium BMS3Abin07]HDL20640.1 glycosyltransferase family 4 protein [Nitrospirota bacterium]HDO23132.1 glycosyltransferase family 4 protein [Nitrospirota bacterium]
MKKKRLTILQVATINRPIRPDIGYSPIETVIYNIDKGLQSSGHRSIVACSAGSCVTGEHYVTVPHGLGGYLREDTTAGQALVNTHLLKALQRAKAGDIDIIHMHDVRMAEYLHDSMFNPMRGFAGARFDVPLPIVMTLHVPAESSCLKESHLPYYGAMDTMVAPHVYFVPISEYQKRQYHGMANTCRPVHHGIEVKSYPSKNEPEKDSYLFTIGRITRIKGQDKAIKIAKKTGSRLIIAGCVQKKAEDQEFFESMKGSIDLYVDIGKHPVNKDYYDRVMKPLLRCSKQIIYIGELSGEQKKQWYLHARATLFPIKWGEPFGLVLIESMACGTPVLAFREGAVPEIVVDGETGFVVDSLSGMIDAVGHIDSIDPRKCRRHVQNQFSITSMANKYSELYHHIIEDYKIQDNCDRLLIEHLPKPVIHGDIAV